MYGLEKTVCSIVAPFNLKLYLLEAEGEEEMLTMRYIEKDGKELVKEIKSLMRCPASESITDSDFLIYWNTDGEGVEIHDGTVYVMNENGKTIADYVVSSEWKYKN